MVTAGQFAWTLTVFAASASQSYWMLFASRAMTGLSEGAFLTVISPCVLELAPGLSKTLWYSIYMSSAPIGISIGYLFGSNFGSAFGWRSTFFIEGLVMVPIVMCLLVVYRNPKLRISQAHSSSSEKASFLDEVRALASNRTYSCMVFGLASMFFTGVGLGFFFPTILVKQYHIDKTIAGDIASVNALVTGILGSIIGSLIQDRMLAPHQHKLEAGQINEAEMNAIRCQISVWFCRASAVTAFCMYLISALPDNAYIFISFHAVSNFATSFSIGSFGVGAMNSVDKSQRNHAIGFSLFVSQLLGGFPSPFVMAAMIKYLGYYLAVIVQVLYLIPCMVLWSLAYRSAKRSSSAYKTLLTNTSS